MSKVSLDIADQRKSVHCRVFVEPTAHPSSRNDYDRVESQPTTPTEPDHRASSLAVEFRLTGYHLLNIVLVVAFGTWKVISSGNESWVFLSKTEFGLVAFAGVLIYALQLLKEASPKLCPGFSEIDLIPPIWNFVYRSEVYHFLLSLLPLQPAVSMLLSALDARQGLELGNQSPTFASNALTTAIMGIIFSMLAIMQQLTRVLRLRVLYCFLVHDIMTTTLFVVWAASDCYVVFNTLTSVDYNPRLDDEYLFGHIMTLLPFALLLPRVKNSVIRPLWLRLWKGAFILVMLVAWISYEKLRNLYDVLFVCGIMCFIFFRFSAAAIFPIRHSSDHHRSLEDNMDRLW